MNELERRIEKLEHQLKDKQEEINIADELHYDEVYEINVRLNILVDLNKSYRWNHGFLICVIIVQALLIATGFSLS